MCSVTPSKIATSGVKRRTVSSVIEPNLRGGAWARSKFGLDQITCLVGAACSIDVTAFQRPGGEQRLTIAVLQRLQIGRSHLADRIDLRVVIPESAPRHAAEQQAAKTAHAESSRIQYMETSQKKGKATVIPPPLVS